MIVNGDELTPLEDNLLFLGDVINADDLRDVAALRLLEAKAGFMGSYRIKKQIEALERAGDNAAHAIKRASAS
ncbi:hypothetical protein [Cupriavidus pauculus]